MVGVLCDRGGWNIVLTAFRGAVMNQGIDLLACRISAVIGFADQTDSKGNRIHIVPLAMSAVIVLRLSGLDLAVKIGIVAGILRSPAVQNDRMVPDLAPAPVVMP